MNKNLTPTIGMEVHVELATKSKMFCGCPANHFGKKPNTQTCPTCLGLPGALPVPNKKAVDWTVMIAQALNCKINKSTKFDRKHYFYPDLPKGYQISQYDEPIGVNGFIDSSFGRIRIRRVHLEEDTGKLKHRIINGQKMTLIDFNRSGVPLVEIVTEPDITSSDQAKEYTKELQTIIRRLDISSADMEKGSMRLEANVSLGKDLGYKVEVKNLNSHRFVKNAIDYELSRQEKLIKNNNKPIQETRGWDEKKKVTVSQRVKETEADYRYFPEPDIPPIEFNDKYLQEIKGKIPKLPDNVSKELVSKFGIKKSYAQIISIDKKLTDFSIKAFEIGSKKKISTLKIADYIVNKKLDKSITPQKLVEMLIEKTKYVISDEKELEEFSKYAISSNKDIVEKIKNGNLNAIQALIGDVMRQSKGKADARKVKLILEKLLRL